MNLSNIPQKKSDLIVKKFQGIDSVKFFFENKEFDQAKSDLSPFWVSYNSIVKYHHFFKEKLQNQDYPKIFVPKCYFENNKSFKAILNPTFPLFNNDVRNTSGKSEKHFERYLISEFKNKILTNQSLLLHELYNPLYPDFVYRNEKVIIDIEIDEPYVYSSKRPSHYDEYDRDRNYKFLVRDWFVIRFSEEQIVKYPQDCISFLKNFIKCIEEGKVMELIDNKRTEKIVHKSWEIEDCIQLADSSYRNTYLDSLIE